MKTNKKGVVLLSGGLDSCVLAAYAKSQEYELHAVTIGYGQKHSKEIESAKAVSVELGIPWHFLRLPLNHLFVEGSSELLSGEVSEHRKLKEDEVAPTYVPCRNGIFLYIAAGFAESLGADNLFIAVNVVDYGGYRDCRPEFIEQLRKAIVLGSNRWREGQLKIHHLGAMSKADIVKLGEQLGAPLALTWSCYAGGERPCLLCDSCFNRMKGFFEARIKDPALDDEEDLKAKEMVKWIFSQT